MFCSHTISTLSRCRTFERISNKKAPCIFCTGLFTLKGGQGLIFDMATNQNQNDHSLRTSKGTASPATTAGFKPRRD